MLRRFLIFVVVAFLFSCSPKNTMHVLPVKDLVSPVEDKGIVYYLPRTVVAVEFEVTTERFIPGPYARYADKYLSIKNAPKQRFSQSEITDVSISQYFEPDPNAAFTIVGSNENQIHFSNQNILLGMNLAPENLDFESFNDFKTIPQFFDNITYFTDLSVEENFTSILDTTYRVIEIDSVFQKIPVYNSVMTSKTEEQKAEEAANFIIELRKARFILVQGDLDYLPDSGATQFMLEEFDKIEKRYIELFIGKSFQVKNNYTYIYTPTANKTTDKSVAFYLCDERGIVTQESHETIPVYLLVNQIDNIGAYKSITENQTEEPKKHGLFYRIPSNAIFKVEMDGIIYSQNKMTVPQFGHVSSIPYYMQQNNKLSVKLHPFYGSLLQIN